MDEGRKSLKKLEGLRAYMMIERREKEEHMEWKITFCLQMRTNLLINMMRLFKKIVIQYSLSVQHCGRGFFNLLNMAMLPSNIYRYELIPYFTKLVCCSCMVMV